jgi:hypothetical protein
MTLGWHSTELAEQGAGVEDHQREYLIEGFEGFVEDMRTDFAPDGTLGPETLYLIDYYGRAVAWLRGLCGPGPDLLEFLEERLRVYDRELNYAAIAYEHDALSAAVADLR